jgi:hypothetical protein
MSSRGRFATPADFHLQDCSPYPHVHTRRERLGFVPHSRTGFCRPVPNPNAITLSSLYRPPSADAPLHFVGALTTICSGGLQVRFLMGVSTWTVTTRKNDVSGRESALMQLKMRREDMAGTPRRE